MTFDYYGGTENFDLVFETFDHDSPMLYLIENNGRKHWYHLGEDAVLVTQDGQYILAVNNQVTSDFQHLSTISRLGAQKEEHGSYRRAQYQEEIHCNLFGALIRPGQKDANAVSLVATQFTNEEAVIEANEDSHSSSTAQAKSTGKIQLIQKNGRWQVASRSGSLDAAKCF
jgi:hypothetical protein